MSMNFFETKPALGSEATIMLVMEDQLPANALLQRLWHEIFLFERRFSRFIPASELSQFNRQAGTRQPISPEFHDLLQAAKSMAVLSDNLYNPFILPALQRAGYLASDFPGYEHDPVDDHSDKRVVPAEQLKIYETGAQIPYGTALDMGGLGKGYLADLLADILDRENITGYWVSLGGDMVLSGFDEAGKPWQTEIQSAYQDDTTAPYVVRHDGARLAVATSSTYRRKNQAVKARNLHHLIDPRTGKLASTDVRLTTVVDHSCLRADVLASCATIIGGDQALSYLKSRGTAGAFIQVARKKVVYFGEVIVKKWELQHA